MTSLQDLKNPVILSLIKQKQISSYWEESQIKKALIDSLRFCFMIYKEYIHIYIIGGGDGLVDFQNWVDAIGLSDIVTMVGNKTNPFPYLKQASLFLCPSRYESFGLVLMEAMLLRIPVITTATNGALYVTQNGKFAECIPNTDKAIRDALVQFLTNPSSYRYSLEEAEKWVWQHDISIFGDRLTELIEQCGNK